MMCQVCKTHDRERFKSSILICESCLADKVSKQQIHDANEHVKKLIHDLEMQKPTTMYVADADPTKFPTLFGLPVIPVDGLLTFEKLMDIVDKLKPKSEFQKLVNDAKKLKPELHTHLDPDFTMKWAAAVSDDVVNCKCSAHHYASFDFAAHWAEIFELAMRTPIIVNRAFVARVIDIHFGSTVPLLENATLPLSIS